MAEKAFAADVALSAALAEFQKDPPAGSIFDEARRAASYGFSWFARPSGRCLASGFVEVCLRHAAGAEISAEGKSVTDLLSGLLGHPLAQGLAVAAAAQAAESELRVAAAAQAAEPEQDHVDLDRAAAASLGSGRVAMVVADLAPVEAPAESLAAATGGTVVVDGDESEQVRLAAPLTDQQKAVAVNMISSLSTVDRRAFTIAFRDAFKVPREEKTIAPLITQVRHLEFCDRWSIEAAGGVAP